jgi:transposase
VETFWFTPKDSTMAKHPTRAYPPEFRHKALELVRSGRSVAEVSRQLDVSRQTIMNWMKQDDADSGRRDDILNSDERKELARLRREVKRLTLEQEILSKAAAWFAREADTIPGNLRIRESVSGQV